MSVFESTQVDDMIYVRPSPERPAVVFHKMVRGTRVTASGTFGSRRRELEELATEWERDTLNLSSPSAMASHPAYLQIVGMGPGAIPFLLERIETKPGMWFAALRAITGNNPVKTEHRGNVAAMTRDWLEWGDENGYLRSASAVFYLPQVAWSNFRGS